MKSSEPNSVKMKTNLEQLKEDIEELTLVSGVEDHHTLDECGLDSLELQLLEIQVEERFGLSDFHIPSLDWTVSQLAYAIEELLTKHP